MSGLQIHFEKEFRCIGPECEDQCCHTWNVVLDKPTYEKYHATPNLRPRAEQHIVRITKAPPSDFEYAQIMFQPPSRTCPFLAEDRWCSIHKEFGPSYLSPICDLYPRVEHTMAGTTTTSLLLSCPEAARMLLLQRNLVPIDRYPADGRPRLRHFLRMAEPPVNTPSFPECFADVQTFSLLLLHDRSYPLWERLFLLGMFSKRVAEIFSSNQMEHMPGLFTEYAKIVKEGRLRSAMDGIPAQTTAQLAAVIEVAHRLQTKNAVFVRMHECLHDFMTGICYNASIPIDQMAPTYTEAYRSYYQPFFETHPQILENYLSNYVFRTQFPSGPVAPGEPNTPLTAYLLMSLQYAVVKGLLIGMAGHYREAFSQEHVVKLIQCFAKQVEHCSDFLKGINKDLVTATGMALLLKN
jgi:lysine-N-methylase